LNSNLNDLKPDYIERYISNGDKLKVIVVWNGHSDSEILLRMDINKFEILNITCYDEHLTK